MSKPPQDKQRCRAVPGSGKSLIVVGDGYYQLPATLADLEYWRQSVAAGVPSQDVAAVIDALADRMADAIITGNGTVDDADIDHMVIIHWPDGKNSVVHAARVAASCGVSEADVWEALDELAAVGILARCQDGDGDSTCGDGGYRATVPRELAGLGDDGTAP